MVNQLTWICVYFSLLNYPLFCVYLLKSWTFAVRYFNVFFIKSLVFFYFILILITHFTQSPFHFIMIVFKLFFKSTLTQRSFLFTSVMFNSLPETDGGNLLCKGNEKEKFIYNVVLCAILIDIIQCLMFSQCWYWWFIIQLNKKIFICCNNGKWKAHLIVPGKKIFIQSTWAWGLLLLSWVIYYLLVAVIVSWNYYCFSTTIDVYHHKVLFLGNN